MLIGAYLRYNIDPDEILDIIANETSQRPEKFDSEVLRQAADVIVDQGLDPYYDDAYENAKNKYTEADGADLLSRFLSDQDMPTMYDFAQTFGLEYPYYNVPLGRTLPVVASEFEKVIERTTIWSDDYHKAPRRPDAYIVEPDNSIDVKNISTERGLEFISPPLSMTDMFRDIDVIFAWAKSNKCRTNSSTGLHINVSVPNWSGRLYELDYIKLVLLLGDEHILAKFGRMNNSYARSALGIIRNTVSADPEQANNVLATMRTHMNTLASQLIHGGMTSKYTSINTQEGFIEFRGPGNDWLSLDTAEIKNTVLRCAVALDAAVSPDKYRQEYLKKLYRLLHTAAPAGNNDTIELFVQYLGRPDRTELKKNIKQAQLTRLVNKKRAGGGQKELYRWSVVPMSGGYGEIVVTAATEQEARQRAQTAYDKQGPWASIDNLRAQPIERYTPRDTSAG
jgi:hypothetical protein